MGSNPTPSAIFWVYTKVWHPLFFRFHRIGSCIPTPEWMQGRDVSGAFFHDTPIPQEPGSAFLQLVVPTGQPDSIDRPWRGIVTSDGWKYIALEGQPWLMFDLNEDPFEQVNLAFNTRHAHKHAELQARLRQWIESTGDHFNLPQNEHQP